MAVCVAVLDRNSTPLALQTCQPEKELDFHYIVHTSIDVINEKCNVSNAASGASNAKLDGAPSSGTAPGNAHQQPGAAAGNRELYLGVLYSTEQHKVFGYVSTCIQMFLSKK